MNSSKHPRSHPRPVPGSPVNLVEGPRISETALPHLVHHLRRRDIVRAIRPVLDGVYGPAPDAVLVVVRKGQNLVAEELVRPPALAAQVARSDLPRRQLAVQPLSAVSNTHLRARHMPQIRLMIQIRLEAQMVVRVHQLVRHDVLHHAALLHPVGAQHDAVAVVEAAQHARRARAAPHVTAVHVAAQPPDVVRQVPNHGRVLQQVVALLLTAPAVDGRVPCVRVRPVPLLPRRRHRTRRHAVEVLEPVRQRVRGEEFGAADGRGRGLGRRRARVRGVGGVSHNE